MTNIEAALQALKDGIIVKRYDGGFNAFFGSELYIFYDKETYQIGVKSKSGPLFIDGYGKV